MPVSPTVHVDWNKILRPPAQSNVILSASSSGMDVCHLIVASSRTERRDDAAADKAGADKKAADILTTSGAAADDNTLRRIRRQVMGYGVDVIAGEIAARLTTEALGEGKGGDGVSRFKALNDAERIILLAGQTGAEALLVLDQSGVWSERKYVEFDDSGHITQIRDGRDGDTSSGCDTPHPHFTYTQSYIGVRAKLVSLKKQDNAAIIADIDVFQPKAPELAPADYPRFAYKPVTSPVCRERVLTPQFDWPSWHLTSTYSWECVPGTEITSWTSPAAWCAPLVQQLDQHKLDIENMRWDQRYDDLIGEMLAKLFPEGAGQRSKMCANAKQRTATTALADEDHVCADKKLAITGAENEEKECPPSKGPSPCVQGARDRQLAARRAFEECTSKVRKN